MTSPISTIPPTESTPLVSVIVANYNHGNLIERAVSSIEKQTYPNIELIIVDDGSTDGGLSQSKMEEFHGRGHKTIELRTNRGKWFALNTAIKQAKGTLITLQDADDSCLVQRIERQVGCLQMMGSFHNLCGFTHCFSEEDVFKTSQYRTDVDIEDAKVMNHAEVKSQVVKGFENPQINHYYTGIHFETHGASSMFYRQHWEAGLRFNPPDVGLRITNSEDSDHNTRMTLLLQRTSVLMEPLYCYMRGTGTNNEKK